PMKSTRIRILVAAALAALVAAAAATAKTNGTSITGAGSSFVFPLVSAWTPALGAAYGYDLTYGSIGSGAGIAALTHRPVDVDAAYALNNKIRFAAIQNRAGKYTYPGLRAIAEAARGITLEQLGPDNAGSIVNPSRKYAKAYPICTFTYVIVPAESSKGAELK